MKIVRKKSRKPVRAAGGIVMRAAPEPLFAVVQMSKFDAWVLPKGKLNRGETALEAACREVREETGHDVAVHEFVGTLAYEVDKRPKIVQFWRMQALSDEPAYALMHDIRSVRWLPLDQAIAMLTHLREREFLRSVGAFVLAAAADTQAQPLFLAAAAGEPGMSARNAPTQRGVPAANWRDIIIATARGWLRRIRPARVQR